MELDGTEVGDREEVARGRVWWREQRRAGAKRRRGGMVEGMIDKDLEGEFDAKTAVYTVCTEF